MIRLLKRIWKTRSKYPADQVIQDEQFLDKDGRIHMDTYLSYYERETSMDAAVNDSAFVDTFISSFYSVPASNDERYWEQAHGAANYDGGLKTFVVQPGIKRIGVKAFSYNINMKEVTLPDGLVIIDREAFSVCPALNTITIPSTVRFIGKNALDNRLETLKMMGCIPPTISVLGIDKNCNIIVPKNSGEIYRKNRFWRKYIKQISEE